jgi:hypothetical protein
LVVKNPWSQKNDMMESYSAVRDTAVMQDSALLSTRGAATCSITGNSAASLHAPQHAALGSTALSMLDFQSW